MSATWRTIAACRMSTVVDHCSSCLHRRVNAHRYGARTIAARIGASHSSQNRRKGIVGLDVIRDLSQRMSPRRVKLRHCLSVHPRRDRRSQFRADFGRHLAAGVVLTSARVRRIRRQRRCPPSHTIATDLMLRCRAVRRANGEICARSPSGWTAASHPCEAAAASSSLRNESASPDESPARRCAIPQSDGRRKSAIHIAARANLRRFGACSRERCGGVACLDRLTSIGLARQRIAQE